MSAYIKLISMEYPRHIGDIELDPDSEYAHVEWVDMPEYDANTQICYEGIPVEVNGVWYMNWLIRDATQEEKDSIKIQALPN